MQYYIIDCCPSERSRWFYDYYGAIAGCWIRDAISEAEARTTAAQQLQSDGWVPVRVLQSEEVNSSTYERRDEGEYYRQALVDGVVTHIRLLQRTIRTIDNHDLTIAPEELIEQFRNFRLEVLRSGALIAEDRGSVVRHQVEDELESPIWINMDDALRWDPELKITRVGARELRVLLDELITRDTLVGLALLPGALIRFHPLALFLEGDEAIDFRRS